LIKTKIIAHRGASFDAPENSLASVNLAWQQGISHVEIDVKLTKDNIVAVFHDDTTFRYNKVSKPFPEYNFDELSKIDIGSFKGSKFKNERIPSLQQILKTIPSSGILVVELKDGPEMLQPMVELQQLHLDIWDQLEFISFNYDTISAIKKTFPNNKCLWLLDLDYDEETIKSIPSKNTIIRKVKENHLDGINVFAGKIADVEFFKIMHDENFDVYLWTINEVEHAKKYLPFSPEGITTDKPKWITEQLNF